MTVLALRQTPIAQEETKPEEVLIHARFYPNADVAAIDRCPEDLSPREWFFRLHENAVEHYQTLAGGRGFFRIPRERFDAILSQSAK